MVRRRSQEQSIIDSLGYGGRAKISSNSASNHQLNDDKNENGSSQVIFKNKRINDTIDEDDEDVE